jgi:hypothetical protein
MSENKKHNLIDEQPDLVSTDIIGDLKSGIYNLFVALINHQITLHGPEKSLELSIQYLKNIIDNFETVLKQTDEEK